jgi:signal transduction histidine kinase/ActR/RegA family two-component response regulator
MSVQWGEDEPPQGEDTETLERRLGKLLKINSVLMDRVERSMDQQGNAFSLFQTAIGLEAKVRARTEELTSVLRRLERSNEALVVAKEEAERANLSKTRFLAAASHDLLQPLNAARLSISVLSDLQTSDDSRTLSGQIEQSLQTIEDLIKTLLDISKLDAGVVKPEMQEVPLDDILSVLESSFSPQATAKGLKLRIRRCGLLVRSDPILLLRILQNLVSNAVRYTKAGGVLVGVRRRGERCLIDVVDTGSGISQGERETIFEEFYRGAAAAGGSHTGLGLGLAIVQRTVLTLGHLLILKSQLGRGSTFRLALHHAGPAPKLADQQADRSRPPLQEATGATVLLVENDPDVCNATVRLLERWGCRPLTAARVAEIAPLLEQLEAPPDLVLADYHLDHGETGLQALEEVHRCTGMEVPALIVTADRSHAVVGDVLAAGCELMHKPIKPAELRALMTHVLAPHRRPKV